MGLGRGREPLAPIVMVAVRSSLKAVTVKAVEGLARKWTVSIATNWAISQGIVRQASVLHRRLRVPGVQKLTRWREQAQGQHVNQLAKLLSNVRRADPQARQWGVRAFGEWSL